MKKDAMCDMNEGLQGMEGVANEGWSMLVWGRGGWKVGRVKWYIGMGVWYGYGASGRRIRGGVVEKLGETVQGVSKEGRMVLVGRAPVVKACEVGRKVD